MDTVPTIPAAAPLMWLFLLVILTRKQKPGMTLVKLLMRELKWAELHLNLGISNWLFNLPRSSGNVISCPFIRYTGIPGLWTQALDTRLWTLDSVLCTLNPGRWTLDAGPWALNAGLWMLDAGL